MTNRITLKGVFNLTPYISYTCQMREVDPIKTEREEANWPKIQWVILLLHSSYTQIYKNDHKHTWISLRGPVIVWVPYTCL